jgi:hypothetical protein
MAEHNDNNGVPPVKGRFRLCADENGTDRRVASSDKNTSKG